MSKPITILFCASLVLVVVSIVSILAPHPSTSIPSSATSLSRSSLQRIPVRSQVSRHTAEAPKPWEVLYPPEDGPPMPEASSNTIPAKPEVVTRTLTTLTYTGEDFLKGQFNNAVVGANGLQLSEASGPRDGYALSGTFESPEQPFEKPCLFMKARYDGAVPEQSVVVFELRTRNRNNTWSEWRKIETDGFELSQMLDFPAVACQYRVTLLANDLTVSPQIQSITIAPEITEMAAASNETAPADDPQPQSQ